MPQLPASVPIASESPIMKALQNKIRQLEKEAATQRHTELMQQQRFDQQEANRRMEQMAMKMEMDKRDAQAKSEIAKQDAQARCDKLEAKGEMDKRDIQAKSEMDKRDAQARCDKLEALLEKKGAQTRCDKLEAQMRCDKLEAKAEMDKRDAQARSDKLEVALENEKKDRLVQQQIYQLKLEARPAGLAGQMPQLVYGSPPPAAASYILQNTPAVNPPAVLSPTKPLLTSPPFQHPLPQPKSMEQSIVRAKSAAHMMEGQGTAEADTPSSQPALTALPTFQAADTIAVKPITMSSKHQHPALPTAQPSLRPQQEQEQQEQQQQQQQQQQHQPSMAFPVVQQPSLTLQQSPLRSQQQPSPPSPSSNTLVSSKVVVQQQAHGSTKVLTRGAVALPDNAESHFFLSHSQSTGGDQTNAIYLELQQLGFTCWYVLRLYL
jgi:hypothetical protein